MWCSCPRSHVALLHVACIAAAQQQTKQNHMECARHTMMLWLRATAERTCTVPTEGERRAGSIVKPTMTLLISI